MNLPAVYLTPRISPAWHASGRYDPKSNRIFISGSQFFDHDEDTKRYVILHELGHWFRENNVAKSILTHGWNLSKEGPEESFADMFALFVNNEKDCKKTYPNHFNLLHNLVRPADLAEICAFYLLVLDKLSEKSKGDCRAVRCLVLAL
jgi:hypothetical protein